MADAGALWGQARQQPVNYLRNQTIRICATRAPVSCWPLITERLLNRPGVTWIWTGGQPLLFPCLHCSLQRLGIFFRNLSLPEDPLTSIPSPVLDPLVLTLLPKAALKEKW